MLNPKSIPALFEFSASLVRVQSEFSLGSVSAQFASSLSFVWALRELSLSSVGAGEGPGDAVSPQFGRSWSSVGVQ